MARHQRQNCLRETDFIIVIFLRAADGKCRFQNCRQHILRRRFPAGARHGHDRNIETQPMKPRQIFQCVQCIGNRDNGNGCRQVFRPRFIGQQNDTCSGAGSISQECVPVEIFTDERNVQRTFGKGPRIRADTGDRRRISLLQQPPAGRLQNFFYRKFSHGSDSEWPPALLRGHQNESSYPPKSDNPRVPCLQSE